MILISITVNVIRFVGRKRFNKAAEDPPPLARQAGPAEFGQVGDELVPRQDGQAMRSLEDGHQRAAAMDRQHGDGPVLNVAAEPARSGQAAPQGLGRIDQLTAEALDETLQGVVGQIGGAVVTLTGGQHRNLPPRPREESANRQGAKYAKVRERKRRVDQEGIEREKV